MRASLERARRVHEHQRMALDVAHSKLESRSQMFDQSEEGATSAEEWARVAEERARRAKERVTELESLVRDHDELRLSIVQPVRRETSLLKM